jgi:cell division protein FtsN
VPASVPPVLVSPPKETPVPAKSEKVITELPEGAIQGRLWLKGLPEDSYVLQHGTFESLRQARAAMKDKEWLANARVVPVFTEGKEEAEFALVTGPFRTKDRAQNTMARLKLSGSVKVESSVNMYKQALQPKSKP